MAKQILVVENEHEWVDNEAKSFDASQLSRVSYFEGESTRDQWIFFRREKDGDSYITGGDVDWCTKEISKALDSWIFDHSEYLWLKACAIAACSDRLVLDKIDAKLSIYSIKQEA